MDSNDKERRRIKLKIKISKKDYGRLPLSERSNQIHKPKKGKGAYKRSKEKQVTY